MHSLNHAVVRHIRRRRARRAAHRVRQRAPRPQRPPAGPRRAPPTRSRVWRAGWTPTSLAAPSPEAVTQPPSGGLPPSGDRPGPRSRGRGPGPRGPLPSMRHVQIDRLEQREPFITADGSSIRELAGIPTGNAANQSLAEATVPPGGETIEHFHRRSEEIYLFTAGAGRMRLGDEEADVRAGDTVVIAPGSRTSCSTRRASRSCCCAAARRRTPTRTTGCCWDG